MPPAVAERRPVGPSSAWDETGSLYITANVFYNSHVLHYWTGRRRSIKMPGDMVCDREFYAGTRSIAVVDGELGVFGAVELPAHNDASTTKELLARFRGEVAATAQAIAAGLAEQA